MKDIHIHLIAGEKRESAAIFMKKTASIGVDGGAIFSVQPPTFHLFPPSDAGWKERLEDVLTFCAARPGFLPVFWLDPTEKDAAKQVEMAVKCGIRGFKVICTHFFVRECLDIFQLIADSGRPILFHSGILFNEKPAAHFNRPIEFEYLTEVKNLRFSMAHIGWPWCDEYMSLFGKFLYFLNKNGLNRIEPYIDMTPGTPLFYRREALRQIFLAGYNIEKYVLWGSDCRSDYDADYAEIFLKYDRAIIDEIVSEKMPYPVWFKLTDPWKLMGQDNFEQFFRLEQ